ncbi:MAG: phospho-N-acetylmuramoyl-pentapeptide-transferase [Phycisphaerae bacterium]|nr:phospho-N-acetylmuramoyl-pentapeptide-transferase [Phycisphaerae bacterium]
MEHFEYFLQNTLHFYAWQDVLLRSMLALLTSLSIGLWLAPRIIRQLIRLKVGDNPEFNHARLNALTEYKGDTPTMGGVIILISLLVSALLWADITNSFVIKSFFVIVWLGVLGGIDDWLKLTAKTKKRSRDGLLSWEKLAFQVGLSILVAWFLFDIDFKESPDGKMLWLPFCSVGFSIGFIVFLAMAIFTIAGASNAVNIADGMDGLASGLVVIAGLVFVVLCYLGSEMLSVSQNRSWAQYLLLPQISGVGEVAIVLSAMVGATLAFLWYNCHPAQVFMGDVGSLPLGGLLGYAAVITRHELLLMVIGGVFVMELMSVVIQVGYFKYSRKKYGTPKRVFLCAPIHHHFHLKGWSEPQVVIRMWLMAIAFAAFALATLKFR